MALWRLFIANRGAIVVRVISSAKKRGIENVLGVSAADRDTLGARMADRAVVLGPASSAKSYLNARLVVHAAKARRCDALHPDYGFISEKLELARLCESEGLVFVGPRRETIEALGDKLSARAIAHEAGVQTVPGTDRIESLAAAQEAASDLGYPVVMKATSGGGSRGMFPANSAQNLADSFQRASREADAAFGDLRLHIERYVQRARHVKVQIVGDGAGNVVHIGERDCSVQRRYQKLIEEASAVAVPAAVRARLQEAAVRLNSAAKCRNAGTVAFLYDVDCEDFYFIEVNSRIQVKHPVSEAITGVDLAARPSSGCRRRSAVSRSKDRAVRGHGRHSSPTIRIFATTKLPRAGSTTGNFRTSPYH